MIRQLIVWLMCSAIVQSAAVAADDAGLIVSLEGTVLLHAESQRERPALALMRVATGDRLSLAAHARLRIAYFDSAMEETWSGPGEIELGQGEGRSATLGPQRRALPALLVRQLSVTPGREQDTRAGMVMLRGVATPAKLARLEREYREQCRILRAPDPLPEIFMLSGLLELGQKQRIRERLAELAAPASPRHLDAGTMAHFAALAREEPADADQETP